MTLSSFAYTYFLDGNQRSKTELDGRVTNYAYDMQGRIIVEELLRNDPEKLDTKIVYTYDRFGNRESMSVTGAGEGETSYVYHPNNWLLTETTIEKGEMRKTHYRYDANGNEVWREREKFSPQDGRPRGRVAFVALGGSNENGLAVLERRKYNGFNQLLEVYSDGRRFFYTYRPDGLRHQKLVKSTNGTVTAEKTHLWDGQNMVAEVGVNGEIAARYLRGAGILSRIVGAVTEHYLCNAHGDVIQRIHDSGEVAKTYRYDAFGNEEAPEPLDANPFRYCGEYFDAETATLYLRARSYDARNGRFTQEDSAKDGSNWYAYCANNPILLVDPSGNVSARVPTQGEITREYLNNKIQGWNQYINGQIDTLQYHARKNVKATVNYINDSVKSVKIKGLQTAQALGRSGYLYAGVGYGLGAEGSLKRGNLQLDMNAIVKTDVWGVRFSGDDRTDPFVKKVAQQKEELSVNVGLSISGKGKGGVRKNELLQGLHSEAFSKTIEKNGWYDLALDDFNEYFNAADSSWVEIQESDHSLAVSGGAYGPFGASFDIGFNMDKFYADLMQIWS